MAGNWWRSVARSKATKPTGVRYLLAASRRHSWTSTRAEVRGVEDAIAGLGFDLEARTPSIKRPGRMRGSTPLLRYSSGC